MTKTVLSKQKVRLWTMYAHWNERGVANMNRIKVKRQWNTDDNKQQQVWHNKALKDVVTSHPGDVTMQDAHLAFFNNDGAGDIGGDNLDDPSYWVDVDESNNVDAVVEQLKRRRTQNVTSGRRACLQAADDAWQSLLPQLIETFLQWEKYGKPINSGNNKHEPILVVDLTSYCTISVDVIDGQGLASTMAHNGYIVRVPLHPSLAFLVHTLKIYCVVKSWCPSLSGQAFVQSLCNIHAIAYQDVLTTMFSNAFDVYMDIHREINRHLDAIIHVDKRAMLVAACPLCLHRTDKEMALKPSMLLCMDGNESLKWVLRTKVINETTRLNIEQAGRRRDISNMYLEHEYVNKFKDEVKARAASQQKPVIHILDNAAEASANISAMGNEDADGALAGASGESPCEPRWNVLKDDSQKCIVGIFDETGIFVTACRHGVVLFLCDMVRSGELSKYPLAIVNRVIDEISKDIMMSYDVGCGFSTMANNSRLLGPKVQANNFRFCVNAFHGHAHRQECQLA